MHNDFLHRYGPVALVTGASSGIGRSFAELLATRGLDLVRLRPTSVWTSMLGLSLLGAGAHSQADQAVCDQLEEAHRSSYSQMSGVNSKIAGTDLSNEARAILDHHDSQQCEVVHEEAVGGDPAIMYHQHLKAAGDSTDSYIWVAKTTGRVLREEIDIDVSNRGKGHQSLRFNYP